MTASAGAGHTEKPRAGVRLGRSARFPAFDSFRALAALTVFLYHGAAYVGGLGGTVGGYISQWPTGFPAVGVAVFFMISAFLLYRPYAQARYDGAPMPPLLPYGIRRLLRIVPGYWIALVIVALVLGRTYVFTPLGLIRYFGIFQVYGAHTEQAGLAQAWTIDVEMTFYAALAAIAYLMARRRPSSTRSWIRSELGMCGVLILGSLLWQAAAVTWWPSSSQQYLASLITLPASFDFFGAGMALAVVSVAVGSSTPGAVRLIDRAPWLPWLGAAVIYWLLVNSPPWYQSLGRTPAWLLTHTLRWLFALCVLLPGVFGTARKGWLRKVLWWRPLMWVGKVSYGLYLWHVLVLYELHRAGLHKAVGGAAFLVVTFAVSVALGALSWYLIEHPALTLARRLSGLRSAEAGVTTPAAPLSVRAP